MKRKRNLGTVICVTVVCTMLVSACSVSKFKSAGSVPANPASAEAGIPSSSDGIQPVQTSGSSGSQNSAASTSDKNGLPNTAQSSNSASSSNPYFFPDISPRHYKGTFLFDNEVQTAATVRISQIAALQKGMLYQLKLDPISGIPDSYLDLGYYFVTADKIYQLYAYEIQQFTASGTIPKDSTIVCQNEAVSDPLSSEQKGTHVSIRADGDKRLFETYDNQVNTGYYQNITWERGKGIVQYESGAGAESHSIKLTLQ